MIRMTCGILILGFAFMLFGCKSETPKTELDLLEYGLPISIQAPNDPNITIDDLGFWKDVSVKKGDDYFVQIIASDAATIDVNKVKQDQLKSVMDAPFFSKIVEEDTNGFIYEKKIDENNINYDFRFVKIQGDKEYIFQTGLIGTFTEDQVKSMYNSVQ